jgi:hypothetical protein
MGIITVTTQAELDAAVVDAAEIIHIKSPAGVWLSISKYGSSTVEASGSSTVRAYGSSTVRASGSSTVEAYDSSTVRAYGSSTVEASGSSTIRAYDSSTIRAYDSSTVEAYGSSTVRASSHVAVHLHSARATVDGGRVIDVSALDLTDPATWCEHHGVDTKDGTAVLYKALGDDLVAGKGYNRPTLYALGAEVTAPDWRDDSSCGGGLHLSPTPHQAADYRDRAARYLRCTAPLAGLRPIVDGGTPKCKVQALTVTCEVDAFGRELAGEPTPVV